jgi:DNA-binding NtrC family response regulator
MSGYDTQGRLVLLDPDRGVRDALADLLALEGYEVLLAATVQCAIKQVARSLPHLVIVAASIPAPDREQLALRLKEWATPTIVIGGPPDAASALPTIPSPIDVTRLIALIAATLDRHGDA